jgi:uncharacterized protein
VEPPRQFSFRPEKDRQNRRLHGISLGEVRRFDFASALIDSDTRENYSEDREVAYGVIGERLHVLVFTMRGETCHAISLRKATRSEIIYYVENT